MISPIEVENEIEVGTIRLTTNARTAVATLTEDRSVQRVFFTAGNFLRL